MAWVNHATDHTHSDSTSPSTVFVTVAGGSIPAGIIVMWAGLLASIPSGWALCDGTQGTPDLRSTFIKGAAAGVNPGATGGAATHTHAGHAAHVFTQPADQRPRQREQRASLLQPRVHPEAVRQMQCCRHSASEHYDHPDRQRLECAVCQDFANHDPYKALVAAKELAMMAFGIAMKTAKAQWKADLEDLWALKNQS